MFFLQVKAIITDPGNGTQVDFVCSLICESIVGLDISRKLVLDGKSKDTQRYQYAYRQETKDTNQEVHHAQTGVKQSSTNTIVSDASQEINVAREAPFDILHKSTPTTGEMVVYTTESSVRNEMDESKMDLGFKSENDQRNQFAKVSTGQSGKRQESVMRKALKGSSAGRSLFTNTSETYSTIGFTGDFKEKSICDTSHEDTAGKGFPGYEAQLSPLLLQNVQISSSIKRSLHDIHTTDEDKPQTSKTKIDFQEFAYTGGHTRSQDKPTRGCSSTTILYSRCVVCSKSKESDKLTSFYF